MIRETMNTSLLQKALEVVESLTREDQTILVKILSERLQQSQYREIVQQVKEVRQEYQEGKVKFGTVDDFFFDGVRQLREIGWTSKLLHCHCKYIVIASTLSLRGNEAIPSCHCEETKQSP